MNSNAITYYSTTLAARCAAVNRVHDEANFLTATLRTIFAPFVGKRIHLRNSCALTAKAKATLPPAATDCQFWHDPSEYSLRFTVKTHKCTSPDRNGVSCTHYAEATVWVGRIEDGILVSVNGDAGEKPLRTDYSPEEVTQLRKNVEVAEEAVREAKNILWPFGLFDR